MPKLDNDVISYFVEELVRAEKYQESWDIRTSQPISTTQDEEEYDDYIQFYENWLIQNGLFEVKSDTDGEYNIVTDKAFAVYSAGGWGEYIKKESEALRLREVQASEKGSHSAKSSAIAAWVSVFITVALTIFNIHQAHEISTISTQLEKSKIRIGKLEASSPRKDKNNDLRVRSDSAELRPNFLHQ